ncbi:SRPBCC domain-containing protein [Microbacterium sp. BWT-B31]|uniref:SRPBCC domain-containing protein n=1 Tax=Microbacterium sp. BWT-B31 TaxID=3232072 RepID=UPI003528146B
MTNETTGARIETSMHRQSDGRGRLRASSRFPTSVQDLWSAVSEPARLARWLCVVEGEPAEGATLRTRYTSGWEGECLVERCAPPHELVISSTEDDGTVSRLTARIEADGDGAILTIEDTGLTLADLPFHTAGWRVHLEDLHALLAHDQDSTDWRGRWEALVPQYRDLPIE